MKIALKLRVLVQTFHCVSHSLFLLSAGRSADDSGRQDVTSNSSSNSAALSSNDDHESDVDDLSSGSGYPKLDVTVVRLSPSDAASKVPSPAATSGDRQRNRAERKTRRRDRRHVAGDKEIPVPCTLKHFNVSFRGTSWIRATHMN